MNILDALILGVVEGITEFIPVSSTAHLLLAEQLLGIDPDTARATFTIAIQLGAILALTALFGIKKFFEKETFLKLSAGFLPTALAGVFVYPFMKHLLADNLELLVITIGLGGLILVFTDKYNKKFPGNKPLDLKGALLMGCFQALALIPGISRSGGIFVGGLLLKYRRADIVDFAFLLAVPTITAATAYDLWKVKQTLSTGSVMILLVGGITAFLSAFFTARWFIDFTKKNGIAVYGYYRIALALVLLVIVVF